MCWSTPKDDLKAWTYEGVIYCRDSDPNYRDDPPYLFAPDCVQGKDGRFYLYYMSSRMDKIAVAVCETPAGRYSYYGDISFSDGKQLNNNSGYGIMFDPAVLVDDAGVYLYYGIAMQKVVPGFPEDGYRGGFVVRLEDDMKTIKSDPRLIIPGRLFSDGTTFKGHAFLEASSIRHYGNLYYLVYSSENGHELCYATSDSPDGNFTYRGVIISNGDVGLGGRTEEEAVNYLGNNHGGMLKVENKYYIFYHRHTHGHQYSRQGCAESIEIEDDGTIDQAPVTSYGLNGKPLPAYGWYPAGIACYLSSAEGTLHYSSKVKWNKNHPYYSLKTMDVAPTNNYMIIKNMRNGSYCGFKEFCFYRENSFLEVNVSGFSKGSLELFFDDLNNGCKKGTVQTINKDRTKFVFSLDDIEGVHTFYLRFQGKESISIDSLNFVKDFF